MGEAYSAAADDAFSVYWNPAGMTRVSGASLGVMHAEYLGGVTLDHIAYVRQVHRRAWIAGALTYMDIGKMNETDPTGASVGSFRPRNYAATLAVAGDLDPFEDSGYGLGASVKLVRSEVAQRAQTFAFDAGATSPCPSFSEGKRGTCALVVQNLGAPLKFDQNAAPLPAVAKLGWAFEATNSVLISAEAALSRGEGVYGALGSEWTAELSENTGVAMRLGVNSLTWGGPRGLSGVSAGLGVKRSRLGVDYAVVPFGELGLTHRLSLTFSFAGPDKGSDQGFRNRFADERSSWIY